MKYTRFWNAKASEFVWRDADGDVVTDTATIAALEAQMCDETPACPCSTTCSSCVTTTVPTADITTEVDALTAANPGCTVSTQEVVDPNAPSVTPAFVQIPNWTAAQLADINAGLTVTIDTGIVGPSGANITVDIGIEEGAADEGTIGPLSGIAGTRKHVNWQGQLSGQITNLISRAPAGATTGNNKMLFTFSEPLDFKLESFSHSYTSGYERTRVSSAGALVALGNLSTRPEGYVEGDGTNSILFKSNQMGVSAGGNWGAQGNGSSVSLEYWRAYRPGVQPGEGQADDGEYGQDPFRLFISPTAPAPTLTEIRVECPDGSTPAVVDVAGTQYDFSACADYEPVCATVVTDPAALGVSEQLLQVTTTLAQSGDFQLLDDYAYPVCVVDSDGITVPGVFTSLRTVFNAKDATVVSSEVMTLKVDALTGEAQEYTLAAGDTYAICNKPLDAMREALGTCTP